MAGYLIGGRLVAGGGLDAGQITVRAVPASGASFELPMNGDGSLDIDVNLPLVDPVTGVKVDLPNLLVPGRDYLAWVEQTTPGKRDGDVILEAGPIWGDPFTFPKTSRIVANGIWSYFDRRVILPVLAAGKLPRDVTSKWTNLSLRTIAKRIVQQALAHPNSGLPIDFEPDVAGTEEREYPGSDLKMVGEALRDLSEVEGGPDITFRPRFSEDRRSIRWTMLTGDPELKQAGADHYWDVSVPDAHARIVEFNRDGSELATREFQTGATLRNEIRNPSFEDGDDGFKPGTNSTDPEFLNGSAHHGVRFAQWKSEAAGHAGIDVSSRPTVEPGEVVAFSAYGKCLSGTKQMYVLLRFLNTAGENVGEYVSTYANVADGWVKLRRVATAPTGSASVHLSVVGVAAAGGNIFRADSLMFLRSAEDFPYTPEDIEFQAIASDASLTNAGFPLLESVTKRGSVNRTDTLQAYANEAVARGSAHIETLSIVARRDKAPMLGTYWPGDYATINVGENHRIAKGRHRVRIVGLQFGKAGDVTIQCAPERVVSGYPIPSTKRTWLRDKLRTLSQKITETTRGK